jgi:hypothetical protein
MFFDVGFFVFYVIIIISILTDSNTFSFFTIEGLYAPLKYLMRYLYFL